MHSSEIDYRSLEKKKIMTLQKIKEKREAFLFCVAERKSSNQTINIYGSPLRPVERKKFFLLRFIAIIFAFKRKRLRLNTMIFALKRKVYCF